MRGDSRVTTIPHRVRHIVADLAGAIPESVLPASRISALFGLNALDDRLEPQIQICDALETEYERTISWATAKTWRTVQDVIDFLEAREAEARG